MLTIPGPAAMRLSLISLGLLGLAACAPQVPESGPGFQDYNSYMRAQAASNMAAGAAGAPVTAPPPAGGFSPEAAAAAIDRAEGVGPPATAMVAAAEAGATETSLGGTPLTAMPVAPVADPAAMATDSTNRPRGNAPAGIAETTAEMSAVSHTGISDENDFQAVSQRETIESDAARIAANRAQYQEVAPTAVPERPKDTGPNLAQYAISTTNAVGQKVYSRGSIQMGNACAKFSSPDLAQEAFLEAGGPERDRKGLDPDGDGFACGWDPTPYRLAVQQ